MILSRRVALDGAQLDQVDDRILIQSVEPAAGRDQIQTVSLWGGTGSRVTGEHRDSLDIIVKFSINEKSYHMQERAEVLEKVMAWAVRGGWLTVSYKPERKICVIPAQLPAEGDPGQRGNQYSITFRACGVPWWQQSEPTQYRVQNVSSLTHSLGIAGSVDSVMDVYFQNTSGSTINTFEIHTGPSAFWLTDLGLADGEMLTILHEDNGRRVWLRILIISTSNVARSVLDKRAGSDDLTVPPGPCQVTMSAGGAGTLLLRCAGRFA